MTYLLNMMEVLKSEVVGMKVFWGGREKREEGGRRGWWTLCTGDLALSLSGAVLPMVP